MKAMNCLLVSLCAGACTSAALAGGQDKVIKCLDAVKCDKVRMVGQVGGGGFGTRAATLVNYYSNVDLSANRWIFRGTTVHNLGDNVHFEKGGYDINGYAIYPVGSPGKIGEVEFWVIAVDGAQSTGAGVDCTVTLEMFDTVIDWSPVNPSSGPASNTCHTSGDDSINQVSLGGFYVDLTGGAAPYNGFANGYIVDISSAPWNCPDGNGFIDFRTWDYNGGSPPAVPSALIWATFNGVGVNCGYPDGAYPALGWSEDAFSYDVGGDGRYQSSELFFFGGFPFVSNAMIRLAGDDGCSFDLNGNGFVGGDDIGYASELIEAGCPY